MLGKPFIDFTGIVDKIDGQAFRLPVDGLDSDHVALNLFAADPEVAATEKRANEVSSAEVGSSGHGRRRARLVRPDARARAEADVTLGSEVQQDALDLAGSFR